MKKIIFYNLLSVTIFFLLLEISIGYIFPITKQGISPNVINQNSIKPRFNFANVNKGIVFGQEVYTDSEGFRVTKEEFLNKKKPQIKEEIYFIGGSVTFGMGVTQEKTFSGLLKEDANNYNVYNASVIGSDLANNYYILKNKINNKNLKNIIINFSLDDISGHTEQKKTNNLDLKNKKNSKKIIQKLKEIKILAYLNDFIKANSKIYVLLKNFIFDAEEYYYTLAAKSFEEPEKIKYLQEYLDKISTINKNLNNKIIFISIPYSKQIKNNNCYNKKNEENIIENEMKLRNIKFYNLKNLFCDKKNLYLKFDPAHLSIEGHLEVYKFIIEELL